MGRFPRACGDGPSEDRKPDYAAVVFPARAGMDRASTARRRWSPTFSPRVRGWTEATVALPLQALVFPARAGMDRTTARATRSSSSFSPRVRGWTAPPPAPPESDPRFPRACGDGPIATITCRTPRGRFPRACGDGPVQVVVPSGHVIVFPARAGMDRGAQVLAALVSAFSPRVRGWTARTRQTPADDGRRFPRACGDGPRRRVSVAFASPFSPRVRGWTAKGGRMKVVNVVFPARAGMDRKRSRILPARYQFSPRVRGWTVHPSALFYRRKRFPRACGDGPPAISYLGGRVFVFPARAGMDRSGSRSPGRGPGFSPRVRGWTGGPGDRPRDPHRFPRACGDGPESR